MSLRAQVVSLRRRLLSSAYSRLASPGSGGAIVSFTFDDFPRTALTVGGEILKTFGAQGTYYTSAGLMNTKNDLGEQFRREDLDTLLRDGHELASHTFSHVSCRSVSACEFGREVAKGRKALEELTGRTDSGNFAFPFGDVTLNAKKELGREMASCRSIWPGLNGPEVDLNLLRANSLYGGDEQESQVRQLILENERQGKWLIFYSHDVQPMPSKFGCTPGLLEFAVSTASEHGARILTIAEAVAGLSSLRDRGPGFQKQQ